MRKKYQLIVSCTQIGDQTLSLLVTARYSHQPSHTSQGSSQACLWRVLAPETGAPQTSGDTGQALTGLLVSPSTRLEVQGSTTLAENTGCPPVFASLRPRGANMAF